MHYNDEDIQGLVAMGFSEENIQKLLSLTASQLNLAIKKPRKKSVQVKAVEKLPSTAKADKHKRTLVYYTTCSLCGSFNVHSEEVSTLAYKHYNFAYKNMKTKVEVSSCKSCRKFLMNLEKEALIDIILNRKKSKSQITPVESDDAELRLWDFHKKTEMPKGSIDALVLMEDHVRWTAVFYSGVQSLNITNIEI